MKFDIHKFVRDFSLSIAESHNKHYRDGWANLACPFCFSDEGKHHLGYNITDDYWNCYRCGWHNHIEVIHELLRVSWPEAERISKQYGGRPTTTNKTDQQPKPSRIDWPTGCGPLTDRHRDYLISRNYDPDEIESIWKIRGTGPIGPYKFRIIAPIFQQDRMVSYQGRDITDKAAAKYKACPADAELIPHKQTLYGLDQADSHTVAVVEGIMDVWRLGPGAVATFGTQWTWPQVRLLTRFPRVVIMFDAGEEEAKKKAEQLASALAGLGGAVEMAKLPGDGDPDNLSKAEALDFMGEIRGF